MDGQKQQNQKDGVIAITDGKNNIIPLPDGYDIIGENTIEKGVVIKDSKNNEFVWIPVINNFNNTYKKNNSNGTGLNEPQKLNYSIDSGEYIAEEYDTQGLLTRMYSYKAGNTDPFYNYETDFAYNDHYTEMITSVNKYHGFYIGRYETTIDVNNSIGSKYNTTVVTATAKIPQTNNKTCYWYGLYYAQRNSNVVGNNDYLQTNMIWGQQWDGMISYFDIKGINYSAFGESYQGAVVKSGLSTKKASSTTKDIIYNIYDLRTNCYDYTAQAAKDAGDSSPYRYRTYRSGSYSTASAGAERNLYSKLESATGSYASRMTLYIK